MERSINKNTVIRILFYNAIVSGLGIFLIKKFFNSPFNSLYLFFLVLSLLIFDSFIERKKLKNYGPYIPKKKDVRLGLMTFSLLFPISVASRIFFPHFDFCYTGLIGLNSDLFKLIAFSIPISVFIQEFGTRLLFQAKISDLYGSKLATYSTIVNFTLFHFGWFFSASLTNFLIIFVTVAISSIFLAFLFHSTKNIFSTLITHLVFNVVSTFQIFFHTTNLFYEQILWLIWGICFVLFAPITFSCFKEILIKTKIKKLEKISDKFILLLLSIFPLFIVILLENM